MFNFLLYFKFSSGIHPNHWSNSSIPPKHIQKQNKQKKKPEARALDEVNF